MYRMPIPLPFPPLPLTAGVLKALTIKSSAHLVTLHDHYIMIPEAIAAMEEREAVLDHIFSLQAGPRHRYNDDLHT